MADADYPFFEQGQRLRWFRLALGIPTAQAFARLLDWPQSAMSQFETGRRMMQAEPALELRRRFVGFDPVWLWEGDERGLSWDFRERINAVREAEAEAEKKRA